MFPLIRVKVSKDDVLKGQSRDLSPRTISCPIARALQRKFPKDRVSMGLSLGTLRIDKDFFIIEPLSKSRVGRWVEAADRFLKVKPFVFWARVRRG